MPPEFTLVVNPRAARGRARKVRDLVVRILERHATTFEVLETERRGHATDLARSSTAGTVVAVGGDGTIQEVVNGLMGSGKRLGIIPAGSGNDFIKALGVSRDPSVALESLLRRTSRTIDIGMISLWSKNAESCRYFVNGVGIGFDAEVAARTASVRFVSGFGVYFVSVLRTLGSYRAPRVQLTVDGERLIGPRLLVAIGNGPCAGGKFYLTPRADVTDGLLDVCAIDSMGVPAILRLMPRVMRGAHLEMDAVRYLTGRKIELTADRTFPVHADGEVLGREISRVEVEVVGKGLAVVGAEGIPEA